MRSIVMKVVRHMNKTVFLILLGLYLLSACTVPSSERPLEESPSEPVEDVPSEPDATDENDDQQTEMPTPDIDPAATKVAPSGVVNLPAITPAVGDVDEPVVLPAPGVPDAASPLVEAAKADLAIRTGKDISEITHVSTEERTWSDSSLGCPKPGLLYMQVITPGYLIVLEVDDVRYNYHTNSRQAVILCK